MKRVPAMIIYKSLSRFYEGWASVPKHILRYPTKCALFKKVICIVLLIVSYVLYASSKRGAVSDGAFCTLFVGTGKTVRCYLYMYHKKRVECTR